MHNGRVLKHGTPGEIENDAEVQAHLHGRRQALMAWRCRERDRARAARAGRRSPSARRLLRPRPCAAGRVAVARSRRAGRRRPQRHGQDDALQCHHRAGAGARQRSGSPARRSWACRRTQITNRGIGYVPQGRRVWPSLTVDEHLRLARGGRRGPLDGRRASIRLFPRLAERKRPRRRPALGRRAADAGDRPGAAARTRGCWSWTSRPKAWRRSSSTRWSRC